MKFKILYVVLIAIAINTQSVIAQESIDIIIGQKTTIKSEVLNSNREILVYLPASYNENDFKNYPVIYLLDGKKFFHSFSGVVAQLSSDASPQIP